MSSYTPNIPQPNDDPSQSQDLILKNFQTLNNGYGTSGDHYPWTNTTPVEGRKHAKVTFPGLPTTAAPGNIIPAPAAGNCTLFGITRDSQTTPFLARDGLASPTPADFVNLWPLLPIKAFATVNSNNSGNATLQISYNIDTVVSAPVGATQQISFKLLNPMRTVLYGILTMASQGSDGIRGYSITDQQNFTVIKNGGGPFPYVLTVIVLEP